MNTEVEQLLKQTRRLVGTAIFEDDAANMANLLKALNESNASEFAKAAGDHFYRLEIMEEALLLLAIGADDEYFPDREWMHQNIMSLAAKWQPEKVAA